MFAARSCKPDLSEGMLNFANSKINLGLHITAKRPDGYHDLETVFYPVGICDVVELTDLPGKAATAGRDERQNQFRVFRTAIPGVLDDNICLKAFSILQKDFKLPAQEISLLKNIPVGAGLGGGSADAAFIVRLANEKFKLGLSTSQMEDYVRPLGADCAFFIRNRPVYAEGKGDVFSPVALDLSAWYLVLLKPEIHVSTAEAYGGVKPLKPAVPLKEVIAQPVTEWREHLKNDFEVSVFARYPEIAQLKASLYEAGAVYAAMSGSGSSVFGIFRTPVILPELARKCELFYGV